MKVNQWNKIAKDAAVIQDAKNKVLNKKVFSLVKKYASGKKAFDYGCGWGEFANLLKQKGFEVKAYDHANEMVSQAKSNYPDIEFLYRKEFKENLPKLKSKFDVTTANLVLCILSRAAQDELLENAKKITKNNGIIVISLCHPAFDYLTESIVTRRMTPYKIAPKYTETFKYRKSIHENRAKFDDYHHPLEYYFKLFKDHNLEILDVAESETLKTSSYPDFLVFALKKYE